MRAVRTILSIGLVFIFAMIVSCSKKSDSIKVNQGLAARIGKTKITMEEFQSKYDQLTPSQKLEFEGEIGKAKFLDKIIDQELIYLEALKKGLDREEDIKQKLKDARKNVLVGEYYKREIVDKIEIPEEEIKEYYDNHVDEFMTKTLMRAQMLFTTDSMKAVSWRKRLEEGEDFSKLAKHESEDQLTARANGDLGYFNPGGYIKSIGISERFSNAVKNLEAGEISDVISFEKGYAIVKVREKIPGKLKPLYEVRKEIVEKLKSSKASLAYKEELNRLREKYKPENYILDRVIATTRTPEELWELARMDDDPYKRIKYYLDLANRYPDHRYAPEALFMAGFIYSEELKDLVQARRIFDKLIDHYPDSDIVESARWMIKNMNKPHPKFDTFEDMKKSMEGEKK